jgi:hypothetical protein
LFLHYSFRERAVVLYSAPVISEASAIADHSLGRKPLLSSSPIFQAKNFYFILPRYFETPLKESGGYLLLATLKNAARRFKGYLPNIAHTILKLLLNFL